MKIIFAIFDKICCWGNKYLPYSILFYDNSFVRIVCFLLFCLDVYMMIDCKPFLKADTFKIMSLLILTVCYTMYIISICLPN